MSSETGEIKCAPSKSGDISHNEPSEGGKNCQLCVVTVLGLALKPGGLPPPELRDRCALGAKIAKEKNATKIIPTGGDPKKRGITEAEAMGRMLQELGVEKEKLILEKEAVDTTANAHNVLKLVRDEVLVHQEKVQLIIVTSAYHMPRSAWLFRVVATAMNLVDVVEIKAASSEGDMVSMQLEEIKKMEKKMKKELRLIKIFHSEMPATLRALGLDTSHIEDIERPKRELEGLLSVLMQH